MKSIKRQSLVYSIMTFNEQVCNNNNNFEVKITAYIDDKQNIWFKGKQVAEILGYVDTNQTKTCML